jgi:LmbE family N-acetylglucosaminyl deacetylase
MAGCGHCLGLGPGRLAHRVIPAVRRLNSCSRESTVGAKPTGGVLLRGAPRRRRDGRCGVALHREHRNLRFILLHATDGEAGEIARDAGVDREQLGAVRRREDEAGWRVIGRVPDRHEWLGFPDGRLAELPAGLLKAEITRVLAEERPDVVLTFGPDGITGHPDHIAVGAATTAAFVRLAGDGGPGFARLYHAAWKQSALDRLNARRAADGLEPFDPAVVFHPRGVPTSRSPAPSTNDPWSR